MAKNPKDHHRLGKETLLIHNITQLPETHYQKARDNWWRTHQKTIDWITWQIAKATKHTTEENRQHIQTIIAESFCAITNQMRQTPHYATNMIKFETIIFYNARDRYRRETDKMDTPASGMVNSKRKQRELQKTVHQLHNQGIHNPTIDQIVQETNNRLLATRKNPKRSGILVTERDLQTNWQPPTTIEDYNQPGDETSQVGFTIQELRDNIIAQLVEQTDMFLTNLQDGRSPKTGLEKQLYTPLTTITRSLLPEQYQSLLAPQQSSVETLRNQLKQALDPKQSSILPLPPVIELWAGIGVTIGHQQAHQATRLTVVDSVSVKKTIQAMFPHVPCVVAKPGDGVDTIVERISSRADLGTPSMVVSTVRRENLDTVLGVVPKLCAPIIIFYSHNKTVTKDLEDRLASFGSGRYRAETVMVNVSNMGVPVNDCWWVTVCTLDTALTRNIAKGLVEKICETVVSVRDVCPQFRWEKYYLRGRGWKAYSTDRPLRRLPDGLRTPTRAGRAHVLSVSDMRIILGYPGSLEGVAYVWLRDSPPPRLVLVVVGVSCRVVNPHMVEIVAAG